MFNKVLLLSASVGAGHTRAAQALERVLREHDAARDIRHVDALQYTLAPYRWFCQRAYVYLENHFPGVMGWFYDRLDKPYSNETERRFLNWLAAQRLRRLVLEYQPDLALRTHFLPGEILSRLKEKGLLPGKLAIAVTDVDTHSIWLARQADHYFVCFEETKAHMVSLGVPPERITVSGIPIDPAFAVPRDKLEMRRQHGLDEQRLTVLLSAGGTGIGPIEQLFEPLLRLRHPIQLLVICGRNDALRQHLQKEATRLSGDAPGAATRPIVHILGFTTDMDQYMAASDLIVGRPGGLTTAEALVRGLVMVIVDPLPGQEERNSDHLLEEGAAIRCNNAPALIWKIDRLLDDPARMAALRAAALRLAKPDAARTIVRKLTEWAG